MWKIPAAGGGVAVPVGRRRPLGAQQIGRRWPFVLPGGKAIVVCQRKQLVVVTATLRPVTLGSGTNVDYDLLISMPLGVIGDQFVYVSPSGGLMAVRFDTVSSKPLGEPVQLEDGVLVDFTGGREGIAVRVRHARVSARTRAVPAGHGGGGRDGSQRRSFASTGVFSTPRFSPDGKARRHDRVHRECDGHLDLRRRAKHVHPSDGGRCPTSGRSGPPTAAI